LSGNKYSNGNALISISMKLGKQLSQ